MDFESFVKEERFLANQNYVIHQQSYDLALDQRSPDGVSVSGLCGWLFIHNGSNHWEPQLLGEICLTEQQVEQYVQTHLHDLNLCHQLGIQYFKVVIPEKQVVLPEKRWSNPPALSDQRPAVILQSAIKDSFLYPVQRLKTAAQHASLYYRGNSHASMSGVWLAFKALTDTLWPEREFLFNSLGFETCGGKHDLLSKYHSNVPEETILKLKQTWQCTFNSTTHQRTGKHRGTMFVYENAQAKFKETILILGDSYAYDCGFSDLFAHFFSKVVFCWTNELDPNLIEQAQPDVVIVESAERFLIKHRTH